MCELACTVAGINRTTPSRGAGAGPWFAVQPHASPLAQFRSDIAGALRVVLAADKGRVSPPVGGFPTSGDGDDGGDG